MEKRNIEITLETAREWYNSNIVLRDIALQAFDEKELKYNFKDIKTFENAIKALGYDKVAINNIIRDINCYSHASAAMFKLNIVRKALNSGQDLYLTKDSSVYYPSNPLITKYSNYYDKNLILGTMEIIGKIKSEGEEYYVLGGSVGFSSGTGLGCLRSKSIGGTSINTSVLGCASKEIARHFSKYFGMLITEAKYGDLSDFQIIERKYT